MKFLFIFCCCFFILVKSTFVFSQDTINLINGKQIFPKNIHEEQNSTLLKYDIDINGKLKQKAVDLLDVYSIVYANTPNKQVYQQDSALGYILTIPQMEHYIIGERTALKYYKVPWVTAGGFALGALAVYKFAFWGLLTPVVYGVGMGILDTKIKAPADIKTKYADDNNFINGYKTIASQKKLKNAILGSLVGALAFIITDEIIVAAKK
jgi:hypothetical protein